MVPQKIKKKHGKQIAEKGGINIEELESPRCGSPTTSACAAVMERRKELIR
jgi:hypothetical protein